MPIAAGGDVSRTIARVMLPTKTFPFGVAVGLVTVMFIIPSLTVTLFPLSQRLSKVTFDESVENKDWL